MREDLEEALEAVELAKAIYRRNGITVAFCNFHIADIYGEMGRHTEAIKLYRSVRKSLEKEDAKEQIAGCDLNLSLIYNDAGQYNRVEDSANLQNMLSVICKSSPKWLIAI